MGPQLLDSRWPKNVFIFKSFLRFAHYTISHVLCFYLHVNFLIFIIYFDFLTFQKNENVNSTFFARHCFISKLSFVEHFCVWHEIIDEFIIFFHDGNNEDNVVR